MLEWECMFDEYHDFKAFYIHILVQPNISADVSNWY